MDLDIAIIIDKATSCQEIIKAIMISFIYFVIGIVIFYLSYEGAKNRG